LHDVLPEDSVEVINLGIPATNSFALLDQANEVISQHPDAVVLYVGHTSSMAPWAWGSTQRLGGGALVRPLLALQRLRTVMLLRTAAVWLRRKVTRAGGPAPDEASFMESLAANKSIPLGSAEYRRGVQQFETNLADLLGRFRSAGVQVFVASQTWNCATSRRSRPMTMHALEAPTPLSHARGTALCSRLERSRAEIPQSARSRRAAVCAPGEFNDVIRRVAVATGATYVPMDERFSGASPHGIAGHELFLEHVHPTRHGYALMGQVFLDACARATFLVARNSDACVRGRV